MYHLNVFVAKRVMAISSMDKFCSGDLGCRVGCRGSSIDTCLRARKNEWQGPD